MDPENQPGNGEVAGVASAGDGDVDPRARELQAMAAGVFQPLPAEPVAGDNDLSPARVDLGRMLYFDARLSKNQDISCNSCHQLDRFGVDGEPTSPGHKGQRGSRNSPTVYNASLQIAQFWDGRAADVEEQAGGPILNPVEMAMPSAEAVTALLKSIPGYGPMFARAFPGVDDPVSYENAAVAIGAFERGLLTPGPLDRFLEGDLLALTPEQQEGMRTFMEVGCTTCHTGATVGGQMFQKLGLVKPYETADLGRYEVTHQEADRYVFKVPSLRNVAETGPWFHDGSVGTLDEAITRMARHQLGKELTPEQVASIATFLGALTGTVDSQYTARPELPASGPDTPAPDPS
ncbi:MAG: cytochrome-c peroxidase [Deltaproteobacteria bacterium]|nr:MAG: cytochrome-c peroxidase [Deltaproteobacteria bacterium]